MHELLQVHNDGENWKRKHKELTTKFNNLWDEEREELGDLPKECATIMKSYLRKYADDDQRYRVIDSEMDEVIELPNGLRINIIIDLIVEDLIEGGLWIRDYKFRKNLSEADDMMLDPQLTTYFWGAEKMGYKPLRGAEYDEVRTKPPTVPAFLKSGNLSRAKNIDTDVYTYMREIIAHGLDPRDYTETLQLIAVREKDRFFRRTQLPKDPPVVKTMTKELVQTAIEIEQAETTGRYPRTFDASCKWGCAYKNICIAQLHGADIDSMIKMGFEVSKRGD